MVTTENQGAGQVEKLFTTVQLTTLKRQIQALRQINIRLKAISKGSNDPYMFRLPPRSLPSTAGRPRGGGSPIAVEKVVSDEEEEEAPSSSSSEESAGDSTSDDEEAELNLSDSDMSAGAVAASIKPRPGVQRPQRAARARKPMVLKDLSSDEEVGAMEIDGDAKEGKKQEAEDAGDAVPAGAGSHGAPASPDRSAQRQRPPSAVLGGSAETVDAKGDEGPVQLLQLSPVRVVWPSDDDAVCSVCGDPDTSEDNVILLCEGEGCGVAVHQLCYGVKIIPEGEWLCDGCCGKVPPQAAACALCPVVGGALRKISKMGRVQAAEGRDGQGGGMFVHSACALWTPEVSFLDPERLDQVDVSGMTEDRLELKCMMCNQAGGATVQCSYGKCCRGFHVLCGRFSECEVTFKGDGEPVGFCPVHSKPQFAAARKDIMAGGEEEEEEEEAAEPVELTSYELQRQENMARIERAKQALLGEFLPDEPKG